MFLSILGGLFACFCLFICLFVRLSVRFLFRVSFFHIVNAVAVVIDSFATAITIIKIVIDVINSSSYDSY